MTIYATMQGILKEKPCELTSKANTRYANATLKTAGDNPLYVSLFVFDELEKNKFLRLKRGDAVAVKGILTCGVWVAENNDARVNYTLAVNAFMSNRVDGLELEPPKKKPRKPRKKSANWLAAG